MDVRDGFVVSIFNYCDRWCERCAFTSHCRLFADCAEIDATLDPGLRVVAEAPPLPAEAPPPLPDWLREVIEDYNRATQESVPATATGEADLERPLPPEHLAIEARSRQYRAAVHAWLAPQRVQQARPTGTQDHPPFGPVDVIAWFHTLLSAKVHRALSGLAEADPLDTLDRDHVGSAKVALLGIDESHAAFLQLLESGRITQAEADPFIADLVWLGEALEQVFPAARAFVRPGLDEPGALERLREST
jgi:hypothetical protein